MPITRSGLFVNAWLGVLANTVALDLSAETFKIALYTNAITPDFSASQVNAGYGVGAFATGEVSGTGYTAGGQTLTGTTLTENPTGTIRFTADNVVWGTSTITAARGALIYADSIAGDPAIFFVDFGENKSSVGGDFIIDWNGTIFSWDVTPG